MSRFGLIGTITFDQITNERGETLEGLGGVLYQTAVLCAFGKDVILYTNLGQGLEEDVNTLTQDWHTLRKKGIHRVPGPGNRVVLRYPEQGERVEILKSAVPPLDSRPILQDLDGLDFLALIMNSGFDIPLRDWKAITESAACPLWMDIHSLPLEKKLNSFRKYVPLTEWKEWVRGVDYLQANKAELASLLGCPGEELSEPEFRHFYETAVKIGVRSVFVTLGEEGVWVMSDQKSQRIPAVGNPSLVDTTGCGDVFCAGAVLKLSEGRDPFEASRFGMRLATAATTVSGIASIFSLAHKISRSRVRQ